MLTLTMKLKAKQPSIGPEGVKHDSNTITILIMPYIDWYKKSPHI